MGQVVTFYSYKGGTGRTMALANLAWIMASNGLRVLAVDFDLESPGLHRYFHPFLPDPRLQRTQGVVEIIRKAAAAALDVRLRSDDENEIVAAHTAQANVVKHAVSVDWASFPDGGTLDLLPAGQQQPGYSDEVSTFDWGNFYDRLGGRRFLELLGRSMRDNYDYVLLDSRTGLSDVAGLLTVEFPDIVVNCFTLSTQSVAGAASVSKYLRDLPAGRTVRILPVPMRVEDAEQAKLEAGRDYARASFGDYLEDLDPDRRERYWSEVEIPYKPYYAYEEILATFGDRPRQEGTLLAAFERLAAVVTDGRVTRLRPVDETARRRTLGVYEQPRTTAETRVLVSYASIDRTWAEWIAVAIADAGAEATIHDVSQHSRSRHLDEAAHLLSRNNRVMTVLSPSYVVSDNARDLWKLTAERATGAPGSLTPVRMDSMRYPPPFTDQPAVELYGLDAEQARTAVLEGLDLRTPMTPARVSVARHRVRYPADAPQVSNLAPRNNTFVGRDVLLERVRDRLATAPDRVVPQSLIGLGGVGKTQIALEFAHRFAADYDTIWWVSADPIGQARSGLAELAVKREVATSSMPVPERVRLVLESLRLGSRWLLVLDNADDPEAFRGLVPPSGGHVLITSRNPSWSEDTEIIQVDAFAREESVALLRRRAPHVAEGDAAELAELLGDLPLAVEQAGAWLKATAMPVERYVEMLRDELPRMLAQPAPGPELQYPDSAAATWLLSLQRMRREMPAAAKVLEICAFFGPDPIPVSLLSGDRFKRYLVAVDPSLVDPLLRIRVIWEIGRYALARIDPGQSSLQMHRLVQVVIRNSLAGDARDLSRHEAQLILSEANPNYPDRPENWPRYAELWPHADPADVPTSTEPEVRQFVLDLVRYLWRSGDLVSSQELAERALTWWDPDGTSHDPTVLLMRFHLANALRLLARYEEAYTIDLEVRDRMRTVLPERHPYVLMVAQSLGGDLRELGRYQESRQLDEETLAGFQDEFGEDNDRTLMALNNLAVSLRLAGEFGTATRIDEDTLARRRQSLGASNPYTLYSAASLARDLREQGDYDKSHDLLLRTLATSREVMGADHLETLRTANSLAVSYKKRAEFDAAWTTAMDTLVVMQRFHGHDHTDTLACSVNLACAESSLGDDEGARARAQEALRQYRIQRGDEHLLTLTCEHNLAIFIRKLGRPGESRPLAEHAWHHLDRLLGEQHPYTLVSQANLANDLFELGDRERARELDERTYGILRRLLGPDHPDVLAVGSNLAVSLRLAGETDPAENLKLRLVARASGKLGTGHPNTVLMNESRRINLEIEPPWV
ncbi:FxSxx-COOH system tetratricopeptide repeat protein [Actinoplanes rectilineatus]|uniref:FxSxx-COOH system tetratricopeptide repeat protein n=1 Tax=Actinoplanes rectilineatus TaxID=113571 RepID=UPI0005F28698|nr:FxSxx-COOH system tetratricopeptide repeat protein [Actinoplanes rectilineatus]